ncbi:MAG TPA: glycosyltransferase [Patescibacteria group bacterium]|nr:glycosyltransferase [Patescibacteria group bacterium]
MDKVTLIITVKNEEKTLLPLLKAIEKQTRLPDEVVITDGGSSDNTVPLLKAWKPGFPVRVMERSGNRAVGRNAAISTATGSIIAITDAGCFPEPSWFRAVVEPIQKGSVDVVAGYYRANAKTPFEQAAAAYMLVMPEQVDGDHFLPATRSMALLKSAWKKVGGFPEEYRWNEDYVFARALEDSGLRMGFRQDAVVVWSPPESWKPFLVQIFRFAYGDVVSGIVRPKMLSIFGRYLAFIFILILNTYAGIGIIILYLLWAWSKNAQYVPFPYNLFLLPTMQVLSDIAVMSGSALGVFKRITT